MIRINQIKIPIFEIGTDPRAEESRLYQRAAGLLRCGTDEIRKLRIVKKSVDAREKNDIRFVYSIDVKLRDSLTGRSRITEAEYTDKLRNRNISISEKIPLTIPKVGNECLCRPLIIGAGPCGIFAAIALTEAGLKPVIIERGDRVDKRVLKARESIKSGIPDPDSNIQFGEGGAGTFSDGKLSTGIKDRNGYIRYILSTFVRFGADKSILYDQKPHIGTDRLVGIIGNIREYIESRGGEYLFNTRLDSFECGDGRIKSAGCTDVHTGRSIVIPADTIILATGHSSRDTYKMLHERGVVLEQKSFAMGIRIQHPQLLIDEGMYGPKDLDKKRTILGPASYKLTAKSKDGRGVYSFCMCPGGYVINASSMPGALCINGMSFSRRDSGTANSALIVTVNPRDYADDGPLAGAALQQELEERAFRLADGLIPYETWGEFKRHEKVPAGVSSFGRAFKGGAAPADLRSILPQFISDALTDGMEEFGRHIKGFDSDEAVAAGIESRTSSPVRIVRDETLCAPGIRGLYPAGEGAGYAGGIMSAAADGLRAALKIIGGHDEI